MKSVNLWALRLVGAGALSPPRQGRSSMTIAIAGDEAKLYDMAKQKYKQQWDSFSTSEQEELRAELAVFKEARSEARKRG